LFLTEDVKRPLSDSRAFAQWHPNSRCLLIKITSSAGDQASLFTSGATWPSHSSRHCFPELPVTSSATFRQLAVPCNRIASTSRVSSSDLTLIGTARKGWGSGGRGKPIPRPLGRNRIKVFMPYCIEGRFLRSKDRCGAQGAAVEAQHRKGCQKSRGIVPAYSVLNGRQVRSKAQKDQERPVSNKGRQLMIYQGSREVSWYAFHGRGNGKLQGTWRRQNLIFSHGAYLQQ
jgi:hypothetical protein